MNHYLILIKFHLDQKTIKWKLKKVNTDKNFFSTNLKKLNFKADALMN